MLRLIKSLESAAKQALAALLAVLLWRPWRRARLAALSSAKRILLVRIDHRVGEVLLTTPLINRLPGREVHLLVHPKMVRIADGLPGVTRVWANEKSLRSLGELRAQQFDAVINCGNWSTPAVTSAIVTRLIASAGLCVGPATAPASWLMDVKVAPLVDQPSETVQRAHLVDGLRPSAEPLRLSFRAPRPDPTVTTFIASLPSRFAVVNPGGRLDERRVPPAAFAAGATSMALQGVTPVVTWGPGEEALADQLCALCPSARRAVATDIDGLASLLAGSVMALCNNTGPMHLSVAVRCPTLALFSRIDMARWSHPQAPHRATDVTHLLGDDQALTRLVSSEVTSFLGSLSR